MNEELKEDMKILLNNFWILKDEEPEKYYRLKKNQDKLRSYIVKTIGSRLIIHEKFIKLEKIPTIINANTGIANFKSQTDYSYLCLILLFLEDKTKGTYFMLSSLIDYVKNTAIALELNNVPDWTLAKNRKSIARAIDYLLSIKAIKLQDETKVDFSSDEKAEALYVSTGLSNYVMRMFDNEIFNFTSIKDFVKDEWIYQDEDKGDIRRYKIYRNLLFNPCVFTKDLSDSEQDYIKKLRGHIKEDLMNNLELELEVTKNMAFLFEYEDSINKEFFPNNRKISSVVLMVNNKLLEKIAAKKYKLDEYEYAYVPDYELYELITNLKHEKEIYLSKGLKDLTDEAFFKEVIDYMEKYSFLRQSDTYFEISPAIRIYKGSFLEKENKQKELWSDEDV